MDNEKKFSEFRRLVRSEGKIKRIKTNALGDIQVRRYDADFDAAAAICDMADEMMMEYLASYHEWASQRER